MSFSSKEKSERALKVFAILDNMYPVTKPFLDYSNPFELLLSTILAAQCTDERVNKVTPGLFNKYSTPAKLANAEISDLEDIIRSTGFFHQKAKSLKNVSIALMEKHAGKLPETVDDLAKLPGVGRKTANVVAGNCFGASAIIVDTHFKRVSVRLGLVETDNPEKIEAEIKKIIPEDKYTRFSGVINYHGRNTCKAKKPLCPECRIGSLCPYPDKTK
jgi:endonuclease III